MKTLLRATLLTVIVLAVAGTALAQGNQQTNEGARATAELKNAAGKVVGAATFTQQANGVRVQVTVNDIDPGKKGIHIHAVGKCDPPDFASAGGHFNPTSKQHGLQNPQGAHAGDMPNLEVKADRSATYDFLNTAVTFNTGIPASLFDADGSALVIHAAEDDEKTDPTGNSGGRVACGVVQVAQQAASPVTMPPTGGAPVWPVVVTLGGALIALGVLLRTRRWA